MQVGVKYPGIIRFRRSYEFDGQFTSGYSRASRVISEVQKAELVANGLYLDSEKISDTMEIRRHISAKRGIYRQSYTHEDLTNAYNAVIEHSLPVQRAANQFGVPITTLKDRVKSRINIDVVKSGPDPIFSLEQEALLANHVDTMAELGYGYSRLEALNLASDYSVYLGIRTQDKPLSLQWLYSFLQRWPSLKIIKPRNLEIARAKSATQSAINNYFKELDKILTSNNLKQRPHAIYNVDEKGLSLSHKPPKILSGSRYKAQVVTSGKSPTVTVIGGANALGNQIPPFFIFPGKRMPDQLLEGASSGADGTISETGWSNTTIFTNYMKSHLFKYLPERDAICRIACPVYTSTLTPSNIQSAFRKVGIFPFNASVISKESITPSLSFTHTPSDVPQGNDDNTFNRPTSSTDINVSSNVTTATGSNKDVSNNAPTATGSSTSATSFLESRGGVILQNLKISKSRNTLSKVVGGKAITDDTVYSKIEEHIQAQAQTSRKRSSTDNIPSEKSKRKHPSVNKDLPSENSIKKGKSKSNPSKGKAIKNSKIIVDHLSDSDSDISEDEKCIICNRFYPQDQNDYVKIVNWGQCGKCNGWVHLRFCSTVKALRRGDNFYCPNCTDVI
ncbi:hypothetical protein KUTeg_008249 [Tegillarca granosa]|uniref:Zinc finger PHD-type domain-containing protein n=1 Tax=Tegillarca granosa TaxID=220873 RepID=A0ABQ9F8M6_TEGGR|nr:hypothetical protein KUTeg_008249 [Tegillarca granosa]